MPDVVREALFNLLRGHTAGEAVLDCFAGSGAIGLEAISRGASRCVFIEYDKGTRKILERNIELLGAEDRSEVVFADALGPATLNACPDPVHLIFFDPPYAMVRDPEKWPRVKRTIARLIQRLDPKGYMVFRTPNPFLHVIATREQIEREKAQQIQDAGVDPTADEDPFSDDADETEVIVIESNTPKVIYGDVDIVIPGALGPETHAYGSTAIHLYMRDPDVDPATLEL